MAREEVIDEEGRRRRCSPLDERSPLELSERGEEATRGDGCRNSAPVQSKQFVETAIGDEAELDCLGAEPCAAGEDRSFAQDEAGQVRIVGRVVRGAHLVLGKKARPASMRSQPITLTCFWRKYYA